MPARLFVDVTVLPALLCLGLMTAGCAPSTPAPSQQAPTKSLLPADKAEAEADDDVLPPQSEPPVADPQPAEPKTAEAAPTEAKPLVLFDGTSLEHWATTNFGGEGEVKIVDGAVEMQRGSDLTGIHWTGDALPKINYELSLEAQRIDGSDFFCGVVFPIGDSFCSFVAGGWGGSLVGLSSVDEMYAAENETGTSRAFNDKQWYKFRLRVTEHAVTVWIDEDDAVNLKTKGRKFSVHPAVEAAKPLGVSCFATVAAVRNIQIRELSEKEKAPPEGEEEK